MRHLHFTQSLEPLFGGGLGSSSVALHRELLAEGIDSTLCATYGDSPIQPAPRTFEFKRVGPHFLHFAPNLFRAAHEWVKSSDILHGHGFYVGTNYLFGREARLENKPLVYHVHGIFEPYILRRSRWKKQLVHWLFEDANFGHARLWRALTLREADQIRSRGIKAPIVVAPNGLNLNEFPAPANHDHDIETPMAGKLSKKRRRALFLGRIHPKKGLDLLLPCWARLEKARKDWELIVAGPDENGYLAHARAIVESLGLENDVIFTGPVTRQPKRALLYSADLFVLPSYSEGFPMSLLEAMACGVPVAATTACNFPNLFQEGGGWECLPSLDSVETALRAALSASEQERRQRGQIARRLLERDYTWPRITRTLLEACSAYCS
jgi:glycosyltransferase involved in cell wall biosynthesis